MYYNYLESIKKKCPNCNHPFVFYFKFENIWLCYNCGIPFKKKRNSVIITNKDIITEHYMNVHPDYSNWYCCPNCKGWLDLGWLFCPMCGKKIIWKIIKRDMWGFFYEENPYSRQLNKKMKKYFQKEKKHGWYINKKGLWEKLK